MSQLDCRLMCFLQKLQVHSSGHCKVRAFMLHHVAFVGTHDRPGDAAALPSEVSQAEVDEVFGPSPEFGYDPYEAAADAAAAAAGGGDEAGSDPTTSPASPSLRRKKKKKALKKAKTARSGGSRSTTRALPKESPKEPEPKRGKRLPQPDDLPLQLKRGRP